MASLDDYQQSIIIGIAELLSVKNKPYRDRIDLVCELRKIDNKIYSLLDWIDDFESEGIIQSD